MDIKLHANATTTPRIRRYIQQSDKSDRVLAQELGITVATVRRWRHRQDVSDHHSNPKNVYKVLRQEQSMLIQWLRHTLMAPLDELLVMVNSGMQQSISRAALDRYLRRAEQFHMNVLEARELRGKKAIKAGMTPGNLRLFYQRISLLPENGGEQHILWAQEEVSGWIAARAYAGASPTLVVHWLESLIVTAPAVIHSIETENKKLFGNDVSTDHPLQIWSSKNDLTMKMMAEATPDITLRVDCILNEIIPAVEDAGLDGYLQNVCEIYNRQWGQKKLGGMTPETFWILYGTLSKVTGT